MNKLPPNKRKEFATLVKDAQRRQLVALKKNTPGAQQPNPQKGKPPAPPATAVSKAKLATDLQKLAGGNSKLQSIADKLQANQPLKKSDLANARTALAHTQDPKDPGTNRQELWGDIWERLGQRPTEPLLP
jgi:hypothetical protein